MNDPNRRFSPEVKSEAERWRRETFDPAAVRCPERKPFVTDVGIGIEQPTGEPSGAEHAPAYVVAMEVGMEVIYAGLRRTPEEVVRAAIEEDVDWIGVSTLSGAHMTLLPKLRRLLDEQGASDILHLFGGTGPRGGV